ncbi:MAG TPA: iron-sulfur cluster assembly scaffold protein [bacterium]|nr:iron-sulfur cluster assembly scaffold protein [bacterium]
MTRPCDEPESIFSKLHSALIGETNESFSDKVLTLAYEPRHVGEMDEPDAVGHCRGSCGDSMTIFLKIMDDRIEQASFLTDGCGATLACGSAVTSLALGKTRVQAMRIHPQHIIIELDGLPPSHTHCAVLAAQCLKQAIENWPQNNGS